MDRVFVTWATWRVPGRTWVAWSRWFLAAGSLLTCVQTAFIYANVVAAETVRIPRVAWLTAEPETAAIGLTLWALATVTLLRETWWRQAGWMLPVAALATLMLDRQSSLGSFGLLVVIFSALHWVSARLDGDKLEGAPLRLIQTQVSVVFAWTAIAKLSPIFLSGALLAVSFRGPVPLPFEPSAAILRILATATVVAEFTFAIVLWLRPIVRWTVGALVVFHLAVIAFLTPTLGLSAFAAIMASGYALFLAEPWTPVAEG